MLIESTKIQEYINEFMKKTGHLNFSESILVTEALKSVLKFIEILEVSQARENGKHQYIETLQRLKNR
jgi:hypothetical protein